MRHHDVHQDEVRPLPSRDVERLLAVRGREDLPVLLLEDEAEGATDVRLVFRDEDPRPIHWRILALDAGPNAALGNGSLTVPEAPADHSRRPGRGACAPPDRARSQDPVIEVRAYSPQ